MKACKFYTSLIKYRKVFDTKENNMSSEKNNKDCNRCGTCCRKGGPAIHDKDLDLLANNTLRLEDLITFRPGEFVRDESMQKIIPLEQDTVKISPPVNTEEHNWTCRFLVEAKPLHSCALHTKHPCECRALFCKNPEPLLALPADGRQTRKQICEFLKVPAWWYELIDTHSKQCDLAKVAECITKLDTDPKAKEELLELISFDTSYRELVVEKSDLTPELLPFLFGRPLLGLMHQFRVEVLKTDKGLLLKKVDSK